MYIVLTFLGDTQIDFACDANGEVENPDVAQVSENSWPLVTLVSCASCAVTPSILLLYIEPCKSVYS